METVHNSRLSFTKSWTFAVTFICALPMLASTDTEISGNYRVGYDEFKSDLPCKMTKLLTSSGHSGEDADYEWKCNYRQLRSIPTLPKQRFTILNLNFNNVTAIPGKSFVNNTDLAVIKLAVNSISLIESAAFTGLRNLRKIKLWLNLLSSLDANIFHDTPNLVALDLRYNKFVAIPYCALQTLHSLQSLDMSAQRTFNLTMLIRDDPPKCLPESIELSSLSQIYLTGTDEEGSTLLLTNGSFRSPIDMSNLQQLDLRYYERVIIDGENETVSFRNVKSLSIGCFPVDNFQFIDAGSLTSLDIECIIKQQLMDLNSRTLQHLDRFPLTSLSITRHLIPAIYDNTFIWTSSLRHLKLRDNLITFISQNAFQKLELLENLDLSCNKLQELPSGAFQVFNESSSLKEIDLSHNSLLLTTAVSIIPFGTSRILQRIDLSSNAITGIAHGYLNIKSLRYLNLADNQMSNVIPWLNQIPNLEVLNLAKNRFINLPPPGWSNRMLMLNHLILSTGKVGYSYVYGDISSLMRSAPMLEFLDLSKSNTLCGTIVFKGSIKSKSESYLKTLDLSSNCLDSNDLNNIYAGYHPRLIWLSLAHNKITELKDDTFAISPAIQNLDLSNNQISYIPANMFTYLGNLSNLYLQYNVLASVDSIKPLISQLVNLNIAKNSIDRIPTDFFPESSDGSAALKSIDMSGNPFECSCENILYFQKWFHRDTVVDIRFEKLSYHCVSPLQAKDIVFTDVNLDCRPRWPGYLGVSLTIFGLICASTVLVYKYRWRIRYNFFILRHRLRRRRYRIFADEENTMPPMGLQYDAFVSYSQDSDMDLEWMQNKLLKNLEECEQPMRLYFAGRDEILGTSKFDVILGKMQQSRKTLLILSPSYMMNEWCYFEMQMAHMRLFDESRDVIIPILLEEIPDNQITLLMRKILLRKTYLKWTDDPIGQELFWGQLRENMQQPSLVNRRFHVDEYNENRE